MGSYPDDVVMNDEEINPENNKLKVVLSDDYSLHQGAYETIRVSSAARPEDILEISFIRTVKVPDNRNSHKLPPDLGIFPIYNVQDYKARFPSNMAAKGGIFFPMYQREAMWMNFEATRPFAVKIYMLAVSMSSLDYLVAGPTPQHQPWIDGIVKEDGSVSQFVAMPQSSRVTVEKQISGHNSVGGIQIEVVPVKSRHYMTVTVKTLTGKNIDLDVTPYTFVWELKLMVQDREGIPPEQQRIIYGGGQLPDTAPLYEHNIKPQSIMHLVLRLRGGRFVDPKALSETEDESENPAEMGIAPGGRITQAVQKDYHPALLWDSLLRRKL